MNTRTLASIGIAAGLVVGVLSIPGFGPSPQVLRADGPPLSLDSDGDFLPDQIEWACLTSAQAPDTDQDGISDFVEVVQRANPRMPGSPLPADHEMRVVVTTNPSPTGPEVTLHLLFRFMGDTSLLAHLDAYAELSQLPGARFPLADVACGPITIDHRQTENDGQWVRVSAPLVSEAVLRSFLPCTIGATATIGTRQLDTHVALIDRAGTTASLVPCGPSLFAVQSIGAQLLPTTLVNNRICVLQLTPVGGGTGGTAFEVTAAECQDCNDLICGVDCANSVGTILILPCGGGSITGG